MAIPGVTEIGQWLSQVTFKSLQQLCLPTKMAHFSFAASHIPKFYYTQVRGDVDHVSHVDGDVLGRDVAIEPAVVDEGAQL